MHYGHIEQQYMLQQRRPLIFLVYGREPVNPIDNRIRQWVETHPKMEEYTETTIQRLLDAKDRVIKNTKEMKVKNKERFDKNRINNKISFRLYSVLIEVNNVG